MIFQYFNFHFNMEARSTNMIAEKIVIKSNNISYGPMPAFNDEVEKHVKIYRDGQY